MYIQQETEGELKKQRLGTNPRTSIKAWTKELKDTNPLKSSLLVIVYLVWEGGEVREKVR